MEYSTVLIQHEPDNEYAVPLFGLAVWDLDVCGLAVWTNSAY
jgi:hypothetical protein